MVRQHKTQYTVYWYRYKHNISGKYIGSQNDIEAAITNMLATRPALQEFFTASTETAEGISLYKAQLSELTDIISALQSSYNALDAAQADMADGGGLSPETIGKLAKAEAWKENANAKMQTGMSEIQKEIDSLEEQNNVLRENIALYNEKAYDTDNIAEMDSYFRLVNEATAELEANTTAIEANQATQEGAVENLNDLIFVTTDATNSTWGLVYAELELMHTMGDLNDSQYQAALHNIQAMQDLAENAIQNIGKATGAAAKNLEETKNRLQDLLDELEDMKDGSDDLVDYVMDMLKHRIQQQINLLEEMKDKYSEIIDLKKKSLDATKDEQDYQKTIAKKLKEMAKLQERINALSLDDSRSARAEKAKLLEELAELQEDLDSTQADKSIEVTKDALDKMEENYHAEKDGEIKILEDSISSTQKLYDMAIEYIRNNWDTLYSELISWNTEYGTSLNSEITTA